MECASRIAFLIRWNQLCSLDDMYVYFFAKSWFSSYGYMLGLGLLYSLPYVWFSLIISQVLTLLTRSG
jgi:hypothetical protein